MGDYPTYDVEISEDARHGKRVLPTIIAGLKPNSPNASDLFERIVTVQLKAELETVDCFCESFGFETDTLAGLSSPLYIATVLDSFCREFPNPFGRFAACEATAKEFVGRCDAFRLAREAGSTSVSAANLAEQRGYCEADEASFLDKLRAREWPLTWLDYGWRKTAERKRLNDGGWTRASMRLRWTLNSAGPRATSPRRCQRHVIFRSALDHQHRDFMEISKLQPPFGGTE